MILINLNRLYEDHYNELLCDILVSAEKSFFEKMKLHVCILRDEMPCCTSNAPLMI